MTRDTHYHPDHLHLDFPKSTHGAPFLSGLPQGEAHDTHKYNIRTTVTAHLDDQHTLSGYVCSDHWLRKVSFTRYHNSLPWPTSRHLQSKRTRWSDNKSLPTITSHDHLLRSMSAALRVMMVLLPLSVHHDNTKYLPTIKEGNKTSNTIYTNIHTKGKVSLLYLVKGQLIYLSLTIADKTIEGCVRTPRPNTFCRWNDWIKNLYWLRSCVHPFGNYVDHQGREASTGSYHNFILIKVI